MKTTISVNGTIYDEQTGMPLRVERGNGDHAHHNAMNVHLQPQKSKTLHRRYLKHDLKSTAKTTSSTTHQISTRHKIAAPTTSPSTEISRFAKPSPHQPSRVIADIAPTRHTVLDRAKQRHAQNTLPARTPKPSDMLKKEAIAHAMAQTVPKSHKKEIKPPCHMSVQRRRLSVVSASVAVLLLGAYFTYLNMPALSTRVAAAQAGINATYPAYQPNGYSLAGPVAYQQGNVTMKFAANAGPQDYTLSQTRSDWDSSAVLDNYVTPQAGNNYNTTTAGGLTMYTYDNKTVWVNNGILYTITGDANLSSDQLQRIATSL